MNAKFTIGMEEEFFLANARSGQIATRVPRSFVQACRDRVGNQAAHELLQSQVETNTPICHTPLELAQAAKYLRREIAATAAEHNLALVASGTFPLAEWREQTHTEKPRYQQLMDDFQIIGRRNLMCGLHVHVEVPAEADRVDVMNRIMPWLPLFLGLSTSSPFWNRQDTGLSSYRQAAYDEWPRTGIPDFFAGESDYNAFVRGLVQSEIIPHAGQLWWAIRPARLYPTLELRIADACTHIEDALSLANLYRCLIRAAVRNPDMGRARTSMTRLLIDENRWQAKRHGKDAEFIDALHGGNRKPLSIWLDDLLELVEEDAVYFGCTNEIQRCKYILQRGTSADQQRSIYQQARLAGDSRTEACRAVVAWLAKQTCNSEDLPVNAMPMKKAAAAANAYSN